ncbi:MAG TPA: molybdopterin cofactor-binding domain-containing protein, partial [Fibrella sp.]
MQTLSNASRRNFLKVAATAGGGLLLGFGWAEAQAMETAADGVATTVGTVPGVGFNSYLSINPQGIITILSPNPEVGQGIKTAFPIVVAEELDADWKNVIVEQAPLDTKKFERQVAGGSGSIPHSWTRLRKAGATARQMLMEAAAKRWNVPATECST